MYIFEQLKKLFFSLCVANSVEFGAGMDFEELNIPKNGLEELKRELSLSPEEIEKTKTMTNREFLGMAKKDRLKYVIRPNINSQDVINGKVKNLIFSFDLDGDGKINKQLYKLTTAGQVLTQEVESVRIGEVVYSRKNLNGEFFDKNNNRLLIHDKTMIIVEKIRTDYEIKEIKKSNDKKLDGYGSVSERYIAEEAISRGIDPKFAILAFLTLFDSIGGPEDGVVLEEMFTQLDRERGYIQGDSDSIETYLATLIKYNKDNWKALALEAGISKQQIKDYESDGMHYMGMEASEIDNADSLDNGERLKGEALLENPEFKKELERVAGSINCKVDDLISVMRAESQIDPRAVNVKSNATGLIQFMPKTAIGLGTTVGKLRKMTGVEQLKYVEKYFLEQNRRGVSLDNVTKLYQATFYPASLGKSKNYVIGGKKEAEQNGVISQYSTRSDGLIDLYAFEKYIEKRVA